jgi:hypothetical protein
MTMRALLVGLLLIRFTALSAEESPEQVLIRCSDPMPAGMEMRVVYGPFWDGAWQLVVERPEDSPVPMLRLDLLEVDRATGIATVKSRFRRPSNDADLRQLWQASATMITGMANLGEERPGLRAEQRPLMIQIAFSERVQCQEGFANWPRLPGTYYFEALEMIHTSVMQPETSREMQEAIRLHLRLVRPVWQ